MTEHELELYRKCMRKKSKFKTRSQYEEFHEYDNNTNENDYDI